jgi:hypothetical protein
LPDFWSFGPTAAAVGLRALGFSPHEAERLVTLKLRYLRGEFPKPTLNGKRLHFVRWLVDHGRLTDAMPDPIGDPEAQLRAA